jgi:hypothetical protein
MNTYLDTTVSVIEKWAIFFGVFIAYYILSSNVIINAYCLTHLPPTNVIRCGMPLLTSLMVQLILTTIASVILGVVMVFKKKFSRSHYRLAGIALMLPLVVVICVVFYE